MPSLNMQRSLAIIIAVAMPMACGGGAEGTSTSPVADGGAPVTPPGCDIGADPKDAPACIVEELGVFVDGESGDDARPGGRTSPVKTISAALGKRAGRPRIYICGDGRYDEHVRLDDASSASLHGGFACSDWKYIGARAAIAPSSDGHALEVSAVRTELTVSDLALTVLDSRTPGKSSIAVFASSSPRLTFRRVVITSGAGLPGEGGDSVAEYSAVAPTGKSGVAGGGFSTANPLCPTSIGAGRGATAGAPSVSPGTPVVTPAYPTSMHNGASGGFVGAYDCSAGNPGSHGTSGTAGAGASVSGQLDENGWRGADGSPGGNGGDGQGGGAGGVPSNIDPGSATPVAGGGGPGGCGGRGGGFGHGGGSSVAVLASSTPIVFESARLIASSAGSGGSGARGQRGQLASLETPVGGEYGCRGGLGGIGGGGGGGGGGAGGVSVGVLYRGAAPIIDGVMMETADASANITVGAPGTGGAGGAAADRAEGGGLSGRGGAQGLDGVSGFAKAVATIP